MMRITQTVKRAIVALVFVLACSASQAGDVVSDFWAQYKELAERGDYVSAWKLLERGHGKSDANIQLTKGSQLLMGWGVERDNCRAALEFEEAKRQGSLFALGFLQYIYNGAWLQIAAEEGNPDALYALAEASWGAYQVGNAMTPFSKLFALQAIFRLYKRAEIAGHPRAFAHLLTLSFRIKQENGEPPIVEGDFKRVICDVRSKR
jgi:TPR repeat protein